MRKRTRSRERVKINLFVYPEMQYMLESLATQAGHIRKAKRGRFAGRPDIGGFLEQWLLGATGLERCTQQQRQQMEDYQIWLNNERLK